MSQLPALKALDVQFMPLAVNDPFWTGSFETCYSKYGKGLACYDDFSYASWVLTYYPDQLNDLVDCLQGFASVAGFPTTIVTETAESGVPFNDAVMAVWEADESIYSYCNPSPYQGQAQAPLTCLLQDECGPNAANDGSGSAPASASAPAPAQSSGSAPVQSSCSVPAPSSGSGSAAAQSSGSASVLVQASASVSGSAPAQAPSSGSGSAPALASASAGSGSTPASASGSGSSSGSAPALGPAPASISAPASVVAPFYSMVRSNNSVTSSTDSQLSTTVVTVTSCSDNKCSESAVTTGLTTVYQDHTTYTTYCPLAGVTANTSKSGSPSTATKPNLSTTVVTVTSCSNRKCSETELSTGVTTVYQDHTTYTTYCPLSVESSTAATASTLMNSTSSTGTYSTSTEGSKSWTTSAYNSDLGNYSGNEGIKFSASKGSLLAAAALLML
ncbi:LANO_0F17722g1_1 [Lachancea nothofagi CBS 11611]|uniref:LANO_0F17722g1_1 n=1 Tax=Lachancea nothofagi CBS 11611 TaxID=1266666 RepID=A0A1G4KD45_9SACH|nr:LANO_0F17722g1_1 [Lachancea nothofagi CBS 11611]